MAISVRVDPVLEKELERAAKRQGVTKSQFVVDAIQRALGRKDPHALMKKFIEQEEARADPAVSRAFADHEQPYEAVAARKAITKKLGAKHRVGRSG